VLHQGVGTYGLLVGAYGMGNIISNLVLGSITIRRRVLTMTLGRFVLVGGFLLMVSAPLLPIAMLGAGVAALGGPMNDLPLLLLIQTDLPPEHIGKVYSLAATLESAGLSLGLLLAVPLFQVLSVPLGIALYTLPLALAGAIGLLRFGVREPASRAREAEPAEISAG
jgi:predicted MFS family arabinose efflux permease